MTSWTGVGEVTPIVAVLDNRWEENLSAETRGEEGKSLFKGWWASGACCITPAISAYTGAVPACLPASSSTSSSTGLHVVDHRQRGSCCCCCCCCCTVNRAQLLQASPQTQPDIWRGTMTTNCTSVHATLPNCSVIAVCAEDEACAHYSRKAQQHPPPTPTPTPTPASAAGSVWIQHSEAHGCDLSRWDPSTPQRRKKNQQQKKKTPRIAVRAYRRNASLSACACLRTKNRSIYQANRD